MTKRKQTPLESFGPELLAALIKGGREEVRIPFPQYRQASYFRARLHQLRNVMRSENHPMASVASKARVILLYGEKAGLAPVPDSGPKGPKDRSVPAVIVIKPQDAEFATILAAAGVTADDIRSSDELLGTAEATAPSTAPLADPDFDSILDRGLKK